MTIRVLVVDDSATVRKVLSEELGKFPDVEVVGTATDAYVAREKIAQLRPDVLTLDVEMPRMNGLDFLEKLMQHHPMPVVVVSSVVQAGSANALRALQLGAVEVVSKPGSTLTTPDVGRHLIRAVRAAASARFHPGRLAVDGPVRRSAASAADRLIAIGASTGGTRAIEAVLAGLPADTPGVVIVQHMPREFTAAFAERLNQNCALEVREARDGDRVAPGLALVAPGGQHMLVRRSPSGYITRLKGGPAVHYQRPSVDVLFHSVADAAGSEAVGVLLTGMGADGAKGLLAMHERGAHTIAEAEESAVVFGMPKEAIMLGAASEVQPLARVAEAVLDALDITVVRGAS